MNRITDALGIPQVPEPNINRGLSRLFGNTSQGAPPYSVTNPNNGNGNGVPPTNSSVGNLNGREAKIQKATEVEDKARNVFSRMACSALFWSCISAAILLTAVIVVLTGSLGLIGLAFIPVIGLGAIPAGIHAYTHSDEIVSETKMMGTLFGQFKGDEWFHEITDKLLIGAIPLKNKGHLKELAEKDITHVISIVDRRLMEYVGILHEPVNKDDYKEVGIEHRLYPSKQGDSLHVALIESIVEEVGKIQSSSKDARILLHGGIDSSKARIIAACLFVKKYADGNSDDKKNWTKNAYKEVLKGEPLTNVAHEELEAVQKYHAHLLEDKGHQIAGLGTMGSIYIARDGSNNT